MYGGGMSSSMGSGRLQSHDCTVVQNKVDRQPFTFLVTNIVEGQMRGIVVLIAL